MKKSKANFYPVILAGGRGTRFWPLSRKRMAKQLLPLNSDKSMIQETVERLSALAEKKNFWVVTNDDLLVPIAKQLRALPIKQLIAEPVGRNTAPAIGLAAFILERLDPSAVLGLFPSDHVTSKPEAFKKDIAKAVQIAAAGENIVVLGIKPTRPETGYGYIEVGEQYERGVMRVRRFTEKPNAEKAAEFVESGHYFWNSGVFVWGAKTLANALREHLRETAPFLEKIAASYGTKEFAKTFAKLYPKCENISVDYAVLEPRSAKGEKSSNIFCIPADWGWNDLGSWAALFEHRAAEQQLSEHENVLTSKGAFTHDAGGNFVHSPRKFIAVVGVKDLVVVETDDALLITTRQKSQDVGKVVKFLDEKKLKNLV
ncbi:mannose-6-phosphate isomerase, type 2 [Candidatus Koribacter versatilis Ellin345]|uniref:mannose-1-phosphate guanylyltransferase n=1 Tax=Koribacter versatilis (strain Ellin345) TaxID=204669 RepID=Q1IU75_KORVE|nr:mannose-1-phosphate guanylyltransferase [Candidatus Koribacter versatilis]ABF39575.1 mannose-6-phosphate isomerase, type 2 [Candidatus Koribacter versatilis Ellin345]